MMNLEKLGDLQSHDEAKKDLREEGIADIYENNQTENLVEKTSGKVISLIERNKMKARKRVSIGIGKYDTGASVEGSLYDELDSVEMDISLIERHEPESKMSATKSKKVVESLVNSIKNGESVSIPDLLVRKLGNKYKIIDGHHRFHAYEKAGVKKVRVRIVPENEIEIINYDGKEIDALLEKINMNSPKELLEKYYAYDQELTEKGEFDYKNPDLLNNKIKQCLEEMNTQKLSKETLKQRSEMLFVWYKNASENAAKKYHDIGKSGEFAQKSIEHQEIMGSEVNNIKLAA